MTDLTSVEKLLVSKSTIGNRFPPIIAILNYFKFVDFINKRYTARESSSEKYTITLYTTADFISLFIFKTYVSKIYSETTIEVRTSHMNTQYMVRKNKKQENKLYNMTIKFDNDLEINLEKLFKEFKRKNIVDNLFRRKQRGFK